MNYDRIVQSLLQEAYFSSPAEKTTGIKRHVTFNEADKETQGRKSEKVQAAAEIVIGVLDDHISQIPEDLPVKDADLPDNKAFVDLALSALSSVNFDDKAYQRAFDDPSMEAVPDQITLSDFRMFKKLVDVGDYKMLTPERVRVLTKKVEQMTRDLVAKAEAQAKGDEEAPIDLEQIKQEPAIPQISDYAKELLARKGL